MFHAVPCVELEAAGAAIDQRAWRAEAIGGGICHAHGGEARASASSKRPLHIAHSSSSMSYKKPISRASWAEITRPITSDVDMASSGYRRELFPFAEELNSTHTLRNSSECHSVHYVRYKTASWPLGKSNMELERPVLP